MQEHREVRVTPRESVRTPFVAPELSAPRQLDLELEKGLQGWTDLDAEVEDLTGTHLPVGHADRLIEDMRWGVASRKAPTTDTKRPVKAFATGPNAHHKAMRERAARLAAR